MVNDCLRVMLSYEVYLRHHELPFNWLKNEFSAQTKHLMCTKLYFLYMLNRSCIKNRIFCTFFSKRLVYASDKTIHAIKSALFDYKQRIRADYKFYSQDLSNNLFMHPYTKIEFMQRDLQVSRLTATKYLDALAVGGFLQKQKIGRGNYYVNLALSAVLQG